jgi:hypothetical protein
MNSLGELERVVWKQIQEATERRQSARLAHLGALADEMETKKRDWIARLSSPPESSNTGSNAPSPNPDADFTGRPIRGFGLAGTQVSVNTYKELLLGVANLLRKQHQDAFDRKALSLGGRKRRYFATDARQLKYAHELEGGGLFIETNLNANLIVKICYALVQELGLSPASLTLRS